MDERSVKNNLSSLQSKQIYFKCSNNLKENSIFEINSVGQINYCPSLNRLIHKTRGRLGRHIDACTWKKHEADVSL